jgi:hypothetical protein
MTELLASIINSESEMAAFYVAPIRQSYLAYYIENIKGMAPLGTEYIIEVLCVVAEQELNTGRFYPAIFQVLVSVLLKMKAS